MWEELEVSVGIVEIRCASWIDFMAYVDKKHKSSHGKIFRGQADAKWPIESTLLRAVKTRLAVQFPEWNEESILKVAPKEVTDMGGMIMQSFESHVTQRESARPTDAQLWMMGRHQGLLTPFIDWTRSPYVAAFFAAVDVVERGWQKSGGEMAVFGLTSHLFPFALGKRSHDNAKLSRYALKVEAGYIGNPRGIAQRAVATYMYPQVSVEQFVNEVAKDGEVYTHALERIVLPHSCADDALNHLNRMNVNYMSLFPDAHGLAKQANLNLQIIGYEGMGNWGVPAPRVRIAASSRGRGEMTGSRNR